MASGSALGEEGKNLATKTRQIEIDYTNYKGERAWRRIEPSTEPDAMYFGTQLPYHEMPQWLLRARDVERNVERVFAVLGIQWRSCC